MGKLGHMPKQLGSQAKPFILQCPLGSPALLPKKPFPVSPQRLSQYPQPSTQNPPAGASHPQAPAREECGLTLPMGALASRPWQQRDRLSQQEAGGGSSGPPAHRGGGRDLGVGGCPLPTLRHCDPSLLLAGQQAAQLTPVGPPGTAC